MPSSFRSNVQAGSLKRSAVSVAAMGSSHFGKPIDPSLASFWLWALAMRLRYAGDHRPGLSRMKRGATFYYRRADGRVVRDVATLARIRKLAIPPAWTDVWIAPDPAGHVQATGRDARGRKQYRYHADWRARRDTAKFDHLIDFAHTLPAIRQRVAADLQAPPLSRARVLATVVALLEHTHIRVGNEEYARANGSYGLTTLKDRHVRVQGRRMKFSFKGKSGIRHDITIEDPRLARDVRRCQDLPGQMLFGYRDDFESCAEGRFI